MTEVTSREYWGKKGEVDLFVFRKFPSSPAGADHRPVLFLVHGSSLSSIPSFDLHVPGHDDYSMMDYFAARGFDVWTMDHEGYGRSSRTDANSDVACAVADLDAIFPLLQRETGAERIAVYGQSGGALRAAAFAQAYPQRVDALVLDAFVWTGKGSPTLEKRRERLAEWRGKSRRKVDRAFFHTIFKRDETGLSDDIVAETVADMELAMDDSFPTGPYLDMTANLPLIDPTALLCPVQIIRGEFDGIASDDDLIEFFRLLRTKDKQFCLLSGQAHVGPQATNRHRFLHAMTAFLTMPPRRDARLAAGPAGGA